jgi:hypothetical protein
MATTTPIITANTANTTQADLLEGLLNALATSVTVPTAIKLSCVSVHLENIGHAVRAQVTYANVNVDANVDASALPTSTFDFYMCDTEAINTMLLTYLTTKLSLLRRYIGTPIVFDKEYALKMVQVRKVFDAVHQLTGCTYDNGTSDDGKTSTNTLTNTSSNTGTQMFVPLHVDDGPQVKVDDGGESVSNVKEEKYESDVLMGMTQLASTDTIPMMATLPMVDTPLLRVKRLLSDEQLLESVTGTPSRKPIISKPIISKPTNGQKSSTGSSIWNKYNNVVLGGNGNIYKTSQLVLDLAEQCRRLHPLNEQQPYSGEIHWVPESNTTTTLAKGPDTLAYEYSGESSLMKFAYCICGILHSWSSSIGNQPRSKSNNSSKPGNPYPDIKTLVHALRLLYLLTHHPGSTNTKHAPRRCQALVVKMFNNKDSSMEIDRGAYVFCGKMLLAMLLYKENDQKGFLKRNFENIGETAMNEYYVIISSALNGYIDNRLPQYSLADNEGKDKDKGRDKGKGKWPPLFYDGLLQEILMPNKQKIAHHDKHIT